jgi:tetratricopeptide (TPR) repeat protein
MDEPDLLKRVSDLEQEVKALKTSSKADAKQAGLAVRCQTFARLLIANWVLLSFVSALLIAGYVKYRYGIDYFESYRNASTNKELSKFYEQMGDRLMGRTEWSAAEQAYRSALQINPNNAAATFGLVKAQVFEPVPGEKYWAPEVVDTRLDYLFSRFPDDYQIYFLKALRYDEMGKSEEARSWLQKCIDKNPKFAGCYFQLGSMDFRQSRVAEAGTNFAKVVELDPNLAVAKGALASVYLHLSNYSGAVQQLEESYRISPTAVTAFTLGQAYWYVRRFHDALWVHQGAASYIDKPHDVTDRYIGGPWTSVFLPLRAGDLETIKVSVPVYTVEQKKALMHFELAIDHALLGQIEDANREFAVALTFQPPPEHRHLIQNRMQSLANMVQMSDASKSWLADHRKLLD